MCGFLPVRVGEPKPRGVYNMTCLPWQQYYILLTLKFFSLLMKFNFRLRPMYSRHGRFSMVQSHFFQNNNNSMSVMSSTGNKIVSFVFFNKHTNVKSYRIIL